MTDDQYRKARAEAVRALYHWQYDYDGGFYQQLYALMHKADMENLGRLMTCFPTHGAAYASWASSESGADFFKANGIYVPY